MRKLFKIFFFVLLVFVLLFACFIAYFFAVTSSLSLDEDKLKKPTNNCKIYFSNGESIKNDCLFEYVSISDIPSCVLDCVVAIEDKRFYSHKGIDFRSIFRATKNNLLEGRIKEGGSTISQQLIKNVYLSGEKKLNRKLKEIRLTMKLEKKYTKNEILEMYLNTVYFGEGAYGIQSASKKYFGKEVSNLTLEEGATLIACLKAPSYYNPIKNQEKSLYRRNIILGELYSQKIIDYNSYLQAKSSDITLNFKTNYDIENKLYSEIIDEALTVFKSKDTSCLNDLKIYTQIDKDLLNNTPKLSDYGIYNDYSIIVIDNKNSCVINYYSTIGNIKRLPASTVKPFLVYAPAIEENLISPATFILDEKTNFDGYSPSNYMDKYYGYISVKDALSKSLNIPAIKICNMLGVNKVKNYASKMGIEFTNSDLSIALGNLSGGITLKELSDAYSVFSNDGYYKKSSFICKITNEKGKIVYENKVKKSKVFDQSTCFLISDILYSCSKEGTANKLSSLPFNVCAKTGTNGVKEGNFDAYSIGYTKEYTVAVWVGNGSGELMTNKISGGNYPTAILKEVFLSLYKNSRPTDFEKPKGVSLVKIDKRSYLEDYKILISEFEDEKTLNFYFKDEVAKGINTIKREKLPIIKDYKIYCNYRDIEIYFETENADGVQLTNSSGKVILTSEKENKFCFSVSKDGKYDYYLTPFYKDGEKVIYGEKIKLPTVIAEGKKDILDKPWWED